MAKKFAELRAKMTSQARAQSVQKAQSLPAEMPLHELRRARGLSQKMLAEAWHVQQPSVAKLARRTDMYLSTLRSHIETVGGQLDIVARLPDGSVKINNVADLASMAGGIRLRPTSPEQSAFRHDASADNRAKPACVLERRVVRARNPHRGDRREGRVQIGFGRYRTVPRQGGGFTLRFGLFSFCVKAPLRWG